METPRSNDGDYHGMGIAWLTAPRYTPQETEQASDGTLRYVPNSMVLALFRAWPKPKGSLEQLKQGMDEFDDDTWMHLGQLLGWTVEKVRAMGKTDIPACHPLLAGTEQYRPIQPLISHTKDLDRFKKNNAVRFMLDFGPLDMSDLGRFHCADYRDREHFAQLIGYSLRGFDELSYASDEVFYRAQEEFDMRQAVLDQALMRRDVPQPGGVARTGPRL